MYIQESDIFDRKIKVHIRDRIYEYPGIHISGSINFGNTKNDSLSDISIYNVNASEYVFKVNNNIRVSAGYGNNVGVIAEGTIRIYEAIKDYCDVSHQIKFSSEALLTLEQVYVRSWDTDTSALDIINCVITDCGLKSGIIVGELKNYKHKIHTGTAKELLTQIATDCGLKFYTEGKYVFMLPKQESLKATLELSASTGLLDTPKSVQNKKDTNLDTSMVEDVNDYLEEVSPDSADDLGAALAEVDNTEPKWKVRMFLNHKVSVDSILNIKSRTINGLFRVINGSHGLDDFVTEVEVVKHA